MIEPIDEPVGPGEKKPALVINIQSWATPVVGLLMLAVGLLAGYFVRPLLSSQEQEPTAVAAVPTSTAASVGAAAAPSSAATPSSTQQPVNLQELMDYILPQVRHFKGDPNAPVTIIEFSDFQ